MALITLKEYSERIGKDRSIVYNKYRRGGFKTAVKLGRDIWIDEDEQYIDERVKSGKYIGWHKDFKSTRAYREKHKIKPDTNE